jgi:hypothetical protein
MPAQDWQTEPPHRQTTKTLFQQLTIGRSLLLYRSRKILQDRSQFASCRQADYPEKYFQTPERAGPAAGKLTTADFSSKCHARFGQP